MGDSAAGVWVDAAGGWGLAIVCGVLRLRMGVRVPGFENGFDLSESFWGIEVGGAGSDVTFSESRPESVPESCPESSRSDGEDVSGCEVESGGRLRSA